MKQQAQQSDAEYSPLMLHDDDAFSAEKSSSELKSSTTSTVWKTPVVVRGVAIALLIAAIVVVVDVAVFFKNMQSPQVRTVDISLQGDEASMKVNGFVSKSSLTATVEFAAGQCDYHYRPDATSAWVPGGQVQATFPSEGNNAHEFAAELTTHNTHFEVLRTMAMDVMTPVDVNSLFQVECDVKMQAKVFGLFPTYFTHSTSHTIDMMTLRSSVKKSLKSHPGVQMSQPSVRLVPKTMDLAHAKYQVVINLHKKPKFVLNHETLESFVLRIPETSYSTSLIDRHEEDSNYFVVNTVPAVIDLAQYSKPIAIDVQMDCTPLASNKANALAQMGSNRCVLWSPLDTHRFQRELRENKFMNITTQGNTKNFLMSLMGDSHYLRTIDDLEYTGSTDLLKANPQSKNALSARALLSDPAISTGADCVTVDTNGVQLSHLCSTIEFGFFKFFWGIHGQGFDGQLLSTTSWVPTSEEVAFNSQWEAVFRVNGGEINFALDAFFSQNLHTMQLESAVNFTDIATNATFPVFHEIIHGGWMTDSNGHSKLQVNGTISPMGVGPILAHIDADFGANHYHGRMTIDDSSQMNDNSTMAGQLLMVAGKGEYNFTSNDWVFTLDESDISHAEMLLGHLQTAMAFVHHQNGPRDLTGMLASLQVQDGATNMTVLEMNQTRLMWFSEDSWNKTAGYTMDSVMTMFDNGVPGFGWNTTLMSEWFGNNDFVMGGFLNDVPKEGRNMSTVLHPLSMHVEVDKIHAPEHWVQRAQDLKMTMITCREQMTNDDGWVGQSALGAVAVGTMEGPMSNWNLSIADLTVVFAGQHVAHSAVNFTFNVQDIFHKGLLVIDLIGEDGMRNAAVMHHSNISFFASNTNGMKGGMSVRAATNIVGSVQYNSTFDFHFGNNGYQLLVDSGDYEQDNHHLMVTATGGYHGPSPQLSGWSVTLDAGKLTIADQLMGEVRAALRYGVSEDLHFNANATEFTATIMDGSHNTMFLTRQNITWHSHSNFVQDGSIQGRSHIYIVNASPMDAHLDFHFADQKVNVLLEGLDPAHNVVLQANGSYSGTANDWTAAPVISLLADGQVMGRIQLALAGMTPRAGNIGVLHAGAIVLDQSGMTLLSVDSDTHYHTANGWSKTGAVNANILVTMGTGGPRFNATAGVNYDESHYHIGFKETMLLNDTTVGAEVVSFVDGQYSFKGVNDSMLSITNSLLRFNDIVLVNARLHLSSQFSLSGDHAEFHLAGVDYLNDHSMIYTTPFYREEDSLFWTENAFGWTSAANAVTAFVTTNTTLASIPILGVTSELVWDNDNEHYLMLLRDSFGEMSGLNVWAAADMSHATGEIAEIGLLITLVDEVVFGSATSYDLMTQAATSVSPTLSPTIMPTRAPTVKPTTASPTFAPTLFPTVVFTPSPTIANAPVIVIAATQVISGIDFTTYNANREANDNALKVSIAKCMDGVSPSDITDLVVTAVNRRLTIRTSEVESQQVHLLSSISVSYTVSVASTTASYSTLSSQLAASVSDGSFTSYLHDAATAYGATSLGSASSTGVTTTNANPSSSSSSTLSAGAMAGIIIGGVVFLGLVFVAIYYMCFMTGSSKVAAVKPV